MKYGSSRKGTISLSQMSRVQARLNTLPWREIALLRRILYTHFFILKNPSSLHNLRYLIEHKHLTTEGFAAQTLQQPVTNYTPLFCLPYPSAPSARRIFFALPVIIFTACLTFFTICAEKVCYKLANMYYKVCNMCYKVSNICYKLCNKNFLIGQEKLSCW